MQKFENGGILNFNGNENDVRVGGFQKILLNQQGGSNRNLMFAYKVGWWVKIGQKYTYVIYEWSLTKKNLIDFNTAMKF